MPNCKTTCAYCGVGCGVNVESRIQQSHTILAGRAKSVSTSLKQDPLSQRQRFEQRKTKINGLQLARQQAEQANIILTGDAEHSANYGDLCAKGLCLLESLKLPNKLLYPRMQSKKGLSAEKISWSDAVATVSERFKAIINKHGPSSVAFYLSGQLLTEDYYVANKLAKGFIGSANIDTNSRLCMSSAVSAHQRAFGEDVVPGCYQDFELADVVVLVGANTAWTHPVLFKRILAARETRGTKLVVVDPRKTATATYADLHLQLKPGSDLSLFNGLLYQLSRSERLDTCYINSHTNGFQQALMQVELYSSFTKLAAETELSIEQLNAFFELYLTKPDLQSSSQIQFNKIVTASGQGVNQSCNGTDTGNAIINCHLAMGDIGLKGCGPFSLTGQPNAMGGREVGGMATGLAAHMGYSEPEHALLSQFWKTDTLVKEKGHTATELFNQMAVGNIKAVWIMGTNPLASLPNTKQVRLGLDTCEFVVVSDITTDTDTAKYADILLPAQGWSEKSGTVTNSERTISRQRRFVKPQGESKPDWWALCEVAKSLGFTQGFNFNDSGQIFNEYAALTHEVSVAFAKKRLSLKALKNLTAQQYDDLPPTQWPVTKVEQIGQSNTRLYQDGVFSTDNGLANFVATPSKGKASTSQTTASPAESLLLNSGRQRDHWHTMTKTGHIESLAANHYQPEISLNQQTLVDLSVEVGALVKLSSTDTGDSMLARATLEPSLLDHTAFISMHWSQQFSQSAGVNQVLTANLDPYSSQPGFKHQRVQLQPYPVILQGIVWGQSCIDDSALCWRVTQTIKGGVCLHIAAMLPWPQVLGSLAPFVKSMQWQTLGVNIHCSIAQGRLIGVCITGDSEVSIDVNAVQALVGVLVDGDIFKQLDKLIHAGGSPVVCACTGVTKKEIETQMLDSIDANPSLEVEHAMLVMEAQSKLKCSAVCGSCLNQVNDIATSVLTEQKGCAKEVA